MPDRALIGKEAPSSTVTIDPERVIEFARAIGESDPIHLDRAAARAAGHADVVAPPTYPIAFMAESMDPGIFWELELNIPSIVHGEQEFEYTRPLCGGEELTLRGRIADIWEKQGRSGTLDFVVIESSASDAAGNAVYTSRITLISKRLPPEET